MENNPVPPHHKIEKYIEQAKRYWIEIRGLDKEYSTVMGMLYMMTSLGTAKKGTTVFEEVVGNKSQTFRKFVKKNLDAWR